VARGESEKKGTTKAFVVMREDLELVFAGTGLSDIYMSFSVSNWKLSSPELSAATFTFLRLDDCFCGGSLDLEDAPFLLDEPSSGRSRGTPARSSFIFFPRNFRRPWVKCESAGGGTPMMTGSVSGTPKHVIDIMIAVGK